MIKAIEMSKLFAIPWWSIPLFCVGMYDLYIGNSQGLIILGVTALVSILLRVFDYKFKTLLTIPWWSIPFFIISIYDIVNTTNYDHTAIIRSDPGVILLSVTIVCTVLFIYLVYKHKTKSKVICPNCNRETWKYKDGRLPTIHRSSQCKASGFIEPRKPRGI